MSDILDANDAVIGQFETINQAIDLLSEFADRITSEVDPGNATWADVSKFAHAVDAAEEVIERLK